MHQPVDDKLIEKIQAKILSRLGKPPGLMSVHCVNVFENNWRINVWTKGFTDGGVPTHEITHSFFCELTEGGTLRTNPKIEKRLYRRIANRPSD